MLQRHAFRMRLHPGQADEYRRRHDALWPELRDLLVTHGIRNYSIHLDAETGALFGYLECTACHRMDELPRHPVMQRWWRHMQDLMATHPDGSPVVTELLAMFEMD